ncbi:MAG: oligosaccharide flippase family protein [Bacteroidota bacterium]|nr:oligosaccharide flippase family protein [Bacteroidota bacterium]
MLCLCWGPFRNGVWRLASSTAWVLLGQGLPWLTALLAFPPLWAQLGSVRFGLLGLLWTFLAHAALLDLGLSRALTHRIAALSAQARSEQIRPLLWSALGIALLFGALGACLGGMLAPWMVDLVRVSGPLREEVCSALRLGLWSLPVLLAAGVLRAALEGIGRFAASALGRAIGNAGSMLLPCAVASLGFTRLSHLAGAVVLAWLGAALVQVRWILRDFGPPGANVSLRVLGSELLQLAAYGGWASVSALLGPVFMYADRFALAYFRGPAEVGAYVLVFEPLARFLVLAGSLSAVLIPLYSRSEGLREAHPLSVALLLGALLLPWLAVAAVWGAPLLALWIGAKPQVPPIVFALLSWGVLANSLGQIFFAVLYGLRRPRVVALLHLAELPLYGAALFWFVPTWGIAGASAVWALRMSADAACLSWLAYRSMRSKGMRIQLLRAAG